MHPAQEFLQKVIPISVLYFPPLTKNGVAAEAGLWDRATGFRQAVGLMAQGQQRGLDASGRVTAFKEPSSQLLVRFAPMHHVASP